MSTPNDNEPYCCGYGKFSLGPEDSFLPCCILHDLDYENSSTFDEEVTADKRFCKCVFDIAKEKPWLYPKAVLYSSIVLLFGRFVFRKHLKP